MAISVSFLFSRAAQLGACGITSLGTGFLYCILSLTGLVSKLTDFLSSPSYIIVQCPPSCGRHKLHSFPHPRSRLHSAIPRLDAPVIYIGAFPILTARLGHRSIYNTKTGALALDCLMSYPGHFLGRFLSLCRNAVDVFYCTSQLGLKDIWYFYFLPVVWKTGVQSQVESYQRLKKWYLMPLCETLRIKR